MNFVSEVKYHEVTFRVKLATFCTSKFIFRKTNAYLKKKKKNEARNGNKHLTRYFWYNDKQDTFIGKDTKLLLVGSHKDNADIKPEGGWSF